MSYPLASDPGPYPGALPSAVPLWRVGVHRFWLGDPTSTAGMVELKSPDPANYAVTGSRGEVEHALMANISGVTMFDSITRRWTISWQRLAGRDRQVVNGFYSHLFDGQMNGVWCYPPPEEQNRLTRIQSLCGAAHGVMEGWTANTPPVFDTTVPAPFLGAGVMRWNPEAVNVSVLAALDLEYSAPYLPAESHTWVIWARSVTGSAVVSPRLTGRLSDGTYVNSVDGPNVTVSTAWRPVILTIDPMALAGAQFVIPVLYSRDAHPVFLSCADLRYDDQFGDFEVGAGVARVICPEAVGRTPDVHMNAQATLTLAECVDGAA